MQRWRRPTPARKKVGSVACKEVEGAGGGAFLYWLQSKRMTLKPSGRAVWVELVGYADKVAQAWEKSLTC